MKYLQLNDEQFDRHQGFWNQKMTEWPPELWQYVFWVQRRYGVCGEVISSAIADWIRGTPLHTKVPVSETIGLRAEVV